MNVTAPKSASSMLLRPSPLLHLFQRERLPIDLKAALLAEREPEDGLDRRARDERVGRSLVDQLELQLDVLRQEPRMLRRIGWSLRVFGAGNAARLRENGDGWGKSV
jgi:hypothetical protein